VGAEVPIGRALEERATSSSSWDILSAQPEPVLSRGQMSEYQPMKAVLVHAPFSDPAWIFERKLDGIRCGVVRRAGQVRLHSRGGEVLNDAYPELVEALEGPGPDLVADGEIVAFARGATSFSRLQGRMHIRDPERARRSRIAVYLYLFDLLELGERDLRSRPLIERKRALRRAVRFGGRIRFTPHRVGDGVATFRMACARGWEGIVAKRANSPYTPGRSRDWLKIKCSHRQEFVIGGWTEGKGARRRLGALLVGYWDGDVLRCAGKVGTGFDAASVDWLADELERRERPTPPFDGEGLPRRARWAEPELVAEIEFTEWTRGGKLRHPRYLGLRFDKPAREVVREEPIE
jgi:DNA ligase D-like protein (predicted ligase)